MKIIVGLGNPGREYSQTRHNVGFMAVDLLAERWGAGPWRSKFDAEVAEVRLGAQAVLLVKPQTFMNLSGRAVRQIAQWYKLAPADITAAYDDMDLPVGTARLRKRGSSGGHRGVESMLLELGDEAFGRVRIGIGRPLPSWQVVDHVLAPFPEADRKEIDRILAALVPAFECIAKDGMDSAMRSYSFKPPKAKPAESAGEAK